ncbi:hypothetical protein F5B19DRAFT_62123 [Rostrohypoxylon terebratum]|nr:hypothetical protein F5B19DRAFT_62123 [Rostrohypoxylon terebratum]
MSAWGRPRQTECARTGCSFPCCKSRRDETSRAPSKYCKKHTCAHFYITEEVPRCEKSKDPSDSVCPYHARCPIENCRKARIQIQVENPADELRFKRQKYCGDHTCLHEGCTNMRSTLGQGRMDFRPYCNDHVCHADGCTEKNTRPCGGWYCKSHKCTNPGCSNQAVDKCQYCEEHNQCETASCTNPKRPGKEFCITHLECETDGCHKLKESHSSHCSNHTCGERGCKTSSGNFKYCQEHRCGYQDCGEHRAVEGKFCPRHSCQRCGCQKQRCYRGMYCLTHTCTDHDCGDARDYGDFCENHYRGEYGRRIEERLDEDLRKMRIDIETKDLALEGQRQRLKELDEQVRRLQSARHPHGNGLPN